MDSYLLIQKCYDKEACTLQDKDDFRDRLHDNYDQIFDDIVLNFGIFYESIACIAGDFIDFRSGKMKMGILLSNSSTVTQTSLIFRLLTMSISISTVSSN